MSHFFISVYQYFHQRPKVFWLWMVAYFGVLIWLASRVQFEEDVTKAFPNHAEFEKINYVFKNSSLGERIVMIVSPADSINKLSPDSLVVYAEALADSVNQYSKLIHPVNARIDFARATKFLNAVIDHLPVFLEEKDYHYLDSLARQPSGEIIRDTYLQLSSPLNLYPKKILISDPLRLSKPVLKRLAQQLYDENYVLYDNCIFTKDFQNLIFFVEPAFGASETGNNSQLISILKNQIHHQSKMHVGITASFFGPAVVAVSNAQQLRLDTRLTLSLMIALLSLVFGIYFRSWRPVAILFVPVLGGVLFSLGILSLVKGSVSVLAVAAGSIVLGIAVNYSLHFLVHAKYASSPEEVIQEVSGPLTLGNLTTVLAFLFLQFANAEVLRDIGLFAALSLMGAALCSLVVLPQWWDFLHSSKTVQKQVPEWSLRFLKNGWIFSLILVATLGLGWLASGVKFNSDMNALSFMDEQGSKAQARLEKIQGGVLAPVFTVAEGKTLKQAIQHSEQFEMAYAKLYAEGRVSRINSITAYLHSDSIQQVRIMQWRKFWNKYKNVILKSLPEEEDYLKPLSQNAQEEITREYKIMDEREIDDIASSLFSDQTIKKNGRYSLITILTAPISKRSAITNDLKDQGVFAFDKSSATQMIVSLVRDDFNLILGISSLVVFVALLIAYQRLELVIISFLPMIITWIWILGIMALLGIEFNMINVMISTFIFGLGDDYSIFVMDSLRQDYSMGRKSFGTTTISIVLSALTTMAGLGILIFAKHPALKSIALMSIIGIASVFLMSQTIQPFLFNWMTKRRTSRGLPPLTVSGILNTMLTYFLFVSGSVLLTLTGLVLWFIPFQRKRSRLVLHHLICYFARALIFIGIKINWDLLRGVPARFAKPSLLIANHSSFLDILITVMLYPKIVLFTNKWVWNSPVLGGVVRLAGYLSTQNDFEENLKRCRELIGDGYTIVIFPEGTRSPDGTVGRFHKGAFLLAEKLRADIQPLIIYGAWNTIRKNQLYVSENNVFLKFLDRIHNHDSAWGQSYQQRTRNMGQHMRQEVQQLPSLLPAEYFKPVVKANYRYKEGEAAREASRLLQSFDFDELKHPEYDAELVLVTDCGYGAFALMLSFLKPDAKIIALDKDNFKVQLATHAYLKGTHLKFLTWDEFETHSKWFDLICAQNYRPDWNEKLLPILNPEGKLLIFTDDGEDMLKQVAREQGLYYFKNKYFQGIRKQH